MFSNRIHSVLKCFTETDHFMLRWSWTCDHSSFLLVLLQGTRCAERSGSWISASFPHLQQGSENRHQQDRRVPRGNLGPTTVSQVNHIYSIFIRSLKYHIINKFVLPITDTPNCVADTKNPTVQEKTSSGRFRRTLKIPILVWMTVRKL